MVKVSHLNDLEQPDLICNTMYKTRSIIARRIVEAFPRLKQLVEPGVRTYGVAEIFYDRLNETLCSHLLNVSKVWQWPMASDEYFKAPRAICRTDRVSLYSVARSPVHRWARKPKWRETGWQMPRDYATSRSRRSNHV